MKKHLIRRIGLVTCGVVLVGSGAFAWWWLHPTTELDSLKSGPPSFEWASLRRQQERWQQEGLSRKADYHWTQLQDISVDLQYAVLLSEDVSFFAHGPFDVVALREVVEEWWKGRRLRGGSTISQQLARILYLSNERSLLRKLREAKLAWWLERKLGKERVLELYLNLVEFGPGIFGVEAAAQHFYNRRAAELETDHAAGLAAAIPAPGRDNPYANSPRWEARKHVILVRMQRASWLRTRLLALRDSKKPAGGSKPLR